MLAKFIRPEKFTGWHMAAVMILFFGTVISVNLTLAYFANTSWSGLVVKNSYVASQKFNEVTAERKRQNALGWQTRSGYENGVFTLSITDVAGNPIMPESIEARFGRPTTEADDRTLQLQKAENSSFEGKTMLGSGLWQVDLTARTADGKDWNKAIRFVIEN